MAMRYGLKWPVYAKQWDSMIIKPARMKEFEGYAKRIISHKAEYLDIAKDTPNMVWCHIGLLHLRESSLDFKTYLGNGDPLNKKTTHVPKGRGPFKTFKAGALDALKLDDLINIIDWRLEKILFWAEFFNGPGYHNKGLASPYIWGGTNIQQAGKYIRDNVFSRTTWDTQPGCAPVLWLIDKLDPDFIFTRES